MKISICIPTYEYNGDGVKYLTKLFDSINIQTYKNFNIIISDHSVDNDIKCLCDKYKNNFEIIYVKNKNKIGNSPHNTNNSIKNSDGEIIKIMFQDDFFFSKNALDKINETFNNNKCGWVVNSCNHTNDNGMTNHSDMKPFWNDKIILGVNTISSPSVLSFKKDNGCFFDENLIMLMDCEMYYQLYLKYGKPTIIEDILITNRLHQNQISSLYNENIDKEISYIKNKYFNRL